MTDETLQESHLKFGTTDEPQNFRIQKNEQHRIMEDRISFQKQKTATQRSSFKITTCERFKMVNNDTSAGAMSSQATACHHITGHTPESLIVKLKH